MLFIFNFFLIYKFSVLKYYFCSHTFVHRPLFTELFLFTDRLARVNGVRLYGHVLRRDDDSVLRVALNLEVSGKRKRGRPRKTWKKQVEEETKKIGLKKEDALRRDKWRDGVRAIAEGMG